MGVCDQGLRRRRNTTESSICGGNRHNKCYCGYICTPECLGLCPSTQFIEEKERSTLKVEVGNMESYLLGTTQLLSLKENIGGFVSPMNERSGMVS